MREILADVDRWRAEGKPIVLATVVQTWGSGPRGAGAKMAFTEDARIAGSVSGGCVEGAVVEAGREVLASGRPRLLEFGVADETAWSVGLSCGGKIQIFLNRLEPAPFDVLRRALVEERPAASVTRIGGPPEGLGAEILVLEDGEVHGDIGEGIQARAVEEAQSALSDGKPRRVALGEGEIFVDVHLPPPQLVLVGGVHIAIALAALARTLGYRVIVVDPRSAFGSEERFPGVDRLIQEWPDEALTEIEIHRSTAVATLTHDPKLDDPALRRALASPAFYVGALGSRKTHEKRRRRLLEAGVSEEQLGRLHAPIGLDLGSRTPEEIALSVMAQIVAARNGAL